MILNNSYDDKASQAIALETIQDFLRISLQNACLNRLAGATSGGATLKLYTQAVQLCGKLGGKQILLKES